MFGTSIHWTTFFYLLIDFLIVLFVISRSYKLKSFNRKRYVVLGFLFVLYNITGGFLPLNNFPETLIIQYIITYSVAISLCIFIIYYLYKEYDIVLIQFYFSIRNIIILLASCFLLLFLLPYFLTSSLFTARLYFTLPIALIGCYFLRAFYQRVMESKQINKFITRRSNLSIISVSAVVLLPVLTVIGDYQWVTFTIMNISFYAITTMEIDRYLYFLENKHKINDLSTIKKHDENKLVESTLMFYALTPRELEISLSILDNKSYKKIGENFFIAERTVSKHASNIFKKTGAKNKAEFLNEFGYKANQKPIIKNKIQQSTIV